jgi:hypothetical protein
MSTWIFKLVEMAKKKKEQSEPRHQTTATSSPLRGQNQDQSGVSDKNNSADYTISDETHTMPPAPEWEKTTPEFRKKHAKHLVKVTSKGTHGKGPNPVAEEQIDELVAGVGDIRSKPVNMAQSTGGTKAKNAPSNANSLQKATNQRVSQLDKSAQQQKDQAEKTREQEIENRQKQEAARQKQAQQRANSLKKETTPKSPMKEKPMATEEYELNEGRPKKGADTDEGPDKHPINQLRKVISTRGMHHFEFKNGKKSAMNPGTAHRLLAKHDNMKTSAEKDEFAQRIHHSHDSMQDVIAGKKAESKPKVSLAGKITGTQGSK